MHLHLNGKLVPASEAAISPLDRGFLFGDGVYEGLRAVPAPGGGAHVFAMNRHLDRLRASLREVAIAFDPAPLVPWTAELLAAEGLTDAFVYWQVTRGTPGPDDPPRSRIPPAGLTPTVMGYCSPQPPLSSFAAPPCRRAVTLEDIRWRRGDIKSISLMGNILLTMQAAAAGVDDAIFITPAGLVGEGIATNVILAFADGRIATPAFDSAPLLGGITRAILLEAAPEIEQRPIRAGELAEASEVILIGTTTMVTSVTELDGRPVGGGVPGPVARRLLGLLLGTIRRESGLDAVVS